MRNRRKCALGAGVILALGSAAALAATPFSYQAGQASYQVQAGQTLTVDIYLHEQIPAGAVSSLVTQGGLFSAAFKVTRDALPADGTSIVGAGIDNEFDGEATLYADGRVFEDRKGAAGPGALPDAQGLIHFGSVVISGGRGGDVVQFHVADFDPTLSDVVTYSKLAIDDAPGIDPGSFTVTVVPEPAALGVVSLGLGLGMLRRRRLGWLGA